MDDTELKLSKYRFLVRGHVQGVGYRYYALKHAHILSLSGYAKNLFDGSVEVLAEGLAENVNQFHKLLEIGPSRSVVELCLYDELPYSKEFDDFYIY